MSGEIIETYYNPDKDVVYNDFLESYDYYKPEQDCRNIIKYFEHMCDKSRSKTSGLAFFNKNRNKVCLQITASFNEDLQLNPFVWKYVNTSIKSYGKKYNYLKQLFDNNWCRVAPNYNVQKYDGEKEGFFTLHNEDSGSHPYRMLVWMMYLNDAKSGTEFPYQNKTITPKVGRTVIWPAGWTHPHKGVTPNEGVKYIATGWFYFLPKGNPQFDGRHPDEERIQEIVV